MQVVEDHRGEQVPDRGDAHYARAAGRGLTPPAGQRYVRYFLAGTPLAGPPLSVPASAAAQTGETDEGDRP